MQIVDFKTKQKEIKEAIDFGAFNIIELSLYDMLYHYTSLDALQKIMESGIFRATEYHYLNDMDEFQGVDDVLFPLLEDVFEGCENLHVLIGKVVRNLRNIQAETENLQKSYYVISFSLAQDNLTLWTEFANYGCNMAVNPYSLLEDAGAQKLFKGRVWYTEDEKKDVLLQVIQMVFSHYLDKDEVSLGEISECLDSWDGTEIECVASSIAQLSFFYGMTMKDELYEAEKEYRLIFAANGQPVHFRQRGNMMIPYIEIPIAVKDNFEALSSVTLAPLGKGEMQVRAMEQFLENQGLDGKEVFESRLNLRY